MILFLSGIAFLIAGYFTYGRLVERIVGPDDREPPSVAHADGVDFVPMPRWKNMLIELLNIAGTGPVIGAILGIRFGRVAFVIIPVGCILMGAVHDYLVGMMSMRNSGLGVPGLLVQKSFGRKFATAFSWFLVAMLLLTVTTFVIMPANIISGSWFPGLAAFWPAVAVVFLYYLVATLCPIDKVIGRFYPIVALSLLLGTLALAVALLLRGVAEPGLFAERPEFADFQAANPLFPCLFVTISCGLLSGFHSTQATMVARTLKSERDGRPTFYGMMVCEGLIAMVWAGAALIEYNLHPELVMQDSMLVFPCVSRDLLGGWMSTVTVLSVVVLAVTSGDTALRSMRLMVAELCGISQRQIGRRLLTALPLCLAIGACLYWSHAHPDSFSILWNYLSWCNQTVAAVALMCVFSWLYRKHGSLASLVALLPGLFITVVAVMFILWTPGKDGHPRGLVPGGMNYSLALGIGVVGALLFAYYAYGCARSYEARKAAKSAKAAAS